MSELRWEVNYDGSLVEKETELSENQDDIIKGIFSQNNWTYSENERSGSYSNVTITNISGERYKINLYRGNIRNEKRSPYEKKIQLGANKDPREKKDEITIILGIYVYSATDTFDKSIVVAYPIDINTNYPSNPSLRGVFVNDILQKARIKGLYVDINKKIAAFKPEFIFYYLDNYKAIHQYNNEIGNEIFLENIQSRNESLVEYSYNRIIFGAPGTGKSHLLEEERKDFGSNYERVTFHSNYSYSNFVGTYKPVQQKDENGKEIITYEYVPGPFMRILKKAILNKDKPFLLLIEEINRANVAAVFGEIFQLLDRENGESKYEIAASEDIKKYLLKDSNSEEKFETIKIPANMYIWATMNSADQGVFPMDTAFKRRWDFEYIDIDDNEADIREIIVKLGKDKHEVRWNDLRNRINEILLYKCKVNEDKLLGPYFLPKSVLQCEDNSNYIKDNNKFVSAFKNKVIMYIFEDAAGRQHRSKVFSNFDEVSTYSKLCKKFDDVGEEIFGIKLSLEEKNEDE